MYGKLLAVSLAAFYMASTPAFAQVDKRTTQELGKDNPLPPATGRGLSEQAGTTEPSSKVKTGEDENVFRNGVLTVPGASNDLETTPSKFSVRTSTDDDLPIVAYRLKRLSGEQRRDIARQLVAVEEKSGSHSNATIGSELPAAIALHALTPMPQALTIQYPELAGTAFMSSENKMLIVDLDNNLVIGVLDS